MDGSFDGGDSKDERDSASRLGDFDGGDETLGFAGQMRHVIVEGRQLQLGIVRDILEKEFELRIEANRSRGRSVCRHIHLVPRRQFEKLRERRRNSTVIVIVTAAAAVAAATAAVDAGLARRRQGIIGAQLLLLSLEHLKCLNENFEASTQRLKFIFSFAVEIFRVQQTLLQLGQPSVFLNDACVGNGRGEDGTS